jgi:hypothetical protein
MYSQYNEFLILYKIYKKIQITKLHALFILIFIYMLMLILKLYYKNKLTLYDCIINIPLIKDILN